MKRFFVLFSFVAMITIVVIGWYVSKENNKRILYVPATTLLVDIDTFPVGWTKTPCDTSLCRESMGTNAAESDYYLEGATGHVYEEVFRFENLINARNKFTVYKKTSFDKPEVREPYKLFEKPSEITFESQIADQYYFACGIDVVEQCQLLAQYRNYFVYIYFDLSTEKSSGGLTYPQIERILIELDNKVKTEFGMQTDG